MISSSVRKQRAMRGGCGSFCGDRNCGALAIVEVSGQKMERGDVNVFSQANNTHGPKSGEYLAVVISPAIRKGRAYTAGTPPAPANKVCTTEKRHSQFFEEKMSPASSVRAQTPNPSLAIFLNRTQFNRDNYCNGDPSGEWKPEK